MNRYDEPGKGRKQCKGCNKYVPVACKLCVCGESFDYGKVILNKSEEKLEIKKNEEKKLEEKEKYYEKKDDLEENDVLKLIPKVEEILIKTKTEIELKADFVNPKWNALIVDELKKTGRPFIIMINDYIYWDSIKIWFTKHDLFFKNNEKNLEFEGKSVKNPDEIISEFLKDYPKIKNISWRWKNKDEELVKIISLKRKLKMKRLNFVIHEKKEDKEKDTT